VYECAKFHLVVLAQPRQMLWPNRFWCVDVRLSIDVAATAQQNKL